MADIKNFGIRGIGADVQFGKSGGRVVYDSGNSLFKVTTDGSTLGNMNVATPTSDNHAANKSYVDSVASGLDVKQSVRAASTADVTLSGPGATIDGVTMSSGDRVLLKNQSAAAENGIYLWTGAASAMTRATDMDGAAEFVGAFFFVEEGTVNSDQGFVCSTDGTIVVDTTSIAFTQFTGTGQLTAGAGLSKSGNAMSVNVDDTYVKIDGNDDLTIKGTTTTGQVLRSDGSGGVAYGAVNLTSSDAVTGALPLANGGLGVDASDSSGKTTARSNLGLGSMATQDASSVAITGGSVDLSGGTLTLANDQISGDKISGGTIDSANLSGGAGKTISGFDVTVASGKTLDVDGTFDVDGANGSAMDNVTVGGTTSAAGTFTTMESGSVDINGGAIDGATIGANVAAAGTFTNVDATGTIKTDTLDNYSGTNIAVNAPMDVTGDVGVTGSVTATVAMVSDTISERTGAAGVTVDGVLLKDNAVTATGTSNLTTATIGTADINGGAVDGTVIGANTSAAGTFSTMTTASAAITGGSISGTSIDLSGQSLTLTADSVSGDSVHGGTISNFASTGIDDNATATALTIDSSQNATFGSDLTVTGDLTVNGSVTSISSTNTTIEDNTIVLNNGESGAGVTEGSAGISIDRGTADDALINWNETTDEFELKVGASYGDLKVSTLTGDLTGDSTGAHNGTVGATTPATGAFTTINASSTITGALTGNVTGNVSGNAGTVTNGVYTTDTGTVTNTMLAGSIANNKLSNSAVTIGSTSLSLGTSATTIAGLTSVTSTDFAGDLAGDVTSTGTSTFATVDINGGAIDGSIIGATTSAAGTFSALNSANATITGGAISGATLTSSSVDIDGGAIDATTIGGNTSAAGTFSTLSTASAAITGGTASLTTATATNLNSGNATITGGSISGTDVDLSGQTLTLGNDSVSGNAIHGGTISSASLAGAAGTTISAYDITVGAGKTLDVSSADALTLADNQISGDKVHSGTISDFASTGIDDNATSTKLTLSDTTATFGVNGDFGSNTLTAGASTLASLSVTGNASVSGNLTVSGSVTTTLSETVNIEDNEIVLNSNETGAPSQDGGVVIERGTSDNAALNWNETSDSWELNVGAAKADLHVNDLTVSEIALTNELPLSMGGTHTDTSGYAASSMMTMDGSGAVTELAKGSNSTVLKVAANGTLGYAKADLTADVTGTLPIANGGTGITSAGSDNKVMMSDGSALGMEYVQHVRNSSGVVALDGSGVTSGSGEYVAITNATGKVTLTAKNAAASGAVDMYLQGQGGGDVFIVGQSGEALIQGEDDTDLTVAGGDASGGDAGDLIVKGGNGTGGNASGSVVIKGGNGGSADGNVQIKGADDTAIATFVETASATDHLKVTNGTGGVELAMAGGTNVNMTLAPKGSGILLAPNGYDMSSAADSALATKDYVDDKSATSGSSGTRRVAFTANGSSSFTIGTMANISGKSYYVSRISAKVTTPFVGCDELVVSDGTNTLMTTTDADLSEGGLYIVDLGFELATTGGATITGTLQNGGSSASPTTGVIIVTAEYKQI
jgi:fibronectin-binding autotransporter adhesin